MASAVVLLCLSGPARAEVGTSTLDAIIGIRSSRDARSGEVSDAPGDDRCVVLDAGERLLELPGIAAGFDDYVRLQRHDRSVVFVRSSAVVPDPGIGSVYDER